MAKDNTQYTKVATVYVRGTFYETVPATGAEIAIWGKMFPMLVQPLRYWFNIRAIGSITGTAPDSAQDMHIRGAISPMNLAQEDVETDDFDGNELLDRYFDPRAGSSFSGDDGDAPTALGLGHSVTGIRSPLYSKKELFSKTTGLGLPNKAVFSDANQITYVESYSRKGDFKGKDHNLLLPSAIVLGCNVDAVSDQTDWSTALTGDAGGMNDLYREILEHVGYGSGADIALSGVGAGLDNVTATMRNWMQAGHRAAAVDDVDQAMHLRVTGTIQCAVFDAAPGSKVFTSYR